MSTLLTEEFTVAAAGDAVITRRLSEYDHDRLERLLDRIRSADAGVVNLETLLLDPDEDGYPASTDVSSGLHPHSPPSVAAELAWAGFDLFAAASNHSNDYGRGGMEATMRALDERGLPYAGLGSNLAAARAPTYTETPGGRVGLVAACSSVMPGSEAGQQRPDIPGRPGISPLRVDTTYTAPAESLEQLRSISEAVGLEDEKRRRQQTGFDDADGDTFQLLHTNYEPNITFERADEAGVRRTARERDLEAILAQVRRADRHADWVVASCHTHQGAGIRYNDETVPEFLREFARACIDAGADVFVGHGPHQPRGIELYDGAPIFYSLGNFVLQGETVPRYGQDIYDGQGLSGEGHLASDVHVDGAALPMNETVMGDPVYWESVVPICRFTAGELDSVDLYPISLGFERPRPTRGVPVLEEGDRAADIVDTVAELSAPFGTSISLEDEVGVVDVSDD